MLRAMGASVVAMVMVLLIGPAFIRWLRLNEFGQNIREDGPAGHLTKEGTPTMGGVLIWFAVVIPFLIFSRIFLCCGKALMSQQFLNRPQISSGIQKMRCKTVAQCVRTYLAAYTAFHCYCINYTGNASCSYSFPPCI